MILSHKHWFLSHLFVVFILIFYKGHLQKEQAHNMYSYSASISL